METRHHFSRATIALPAIAMFSSLGTAALAQDMPPITLTAAYAVQADDNLFRLPDGVDPSAASGLQRSDRVGVSTLGVLVQTEQGLQRLELDASLVNYHYQANSSLGYTARNYAGAWRWVVTPRLRGNLTARQQERPSSNSGDTAPNQQNHTTYRADADYEVTGPWHVVAGVSRDKLTNQNAVTPGQEYSSASADVGVRYQAGTGSFVEVSAKTGDGTYLNSLAPPASAIDTKFAQQERQLRVHWAVSEASSVDVNASAIERQHPVFAQRDFSGLQWGGSLLWSLSAKTVLNLGYQHALAAYATALSNYSEADQLFWSWNWQASAKTRLRLRQDYTQTSYRGAPFGATSTRQDHQRDTSIAWVWTPKKQWQISAGVHQVSRGSNAPSLAYTSNQINLSAQFTY